MVPWLFILCLTVTLAACGDEPAPNGQKAKGGTPNVVVAEAHMRERGEIIQALGTLQAKESITLTAKVQNTVRAIHFEDNQRVKKGALLVEMTQGDERAILEAARRQYERIKPLAAQGIVALTVLDQRRQEYESALAASRDQTLIAPFDGVLGLRNVSVGTLVQPGTTITTLDDDRIMRVDFTVPETVMAQLAVGQTFTAKADALGQRVSGTLVGKDSRVDPATRAITLRGEIDNPEGLLKSGMLVRVEIPVNVTARLMVPEEALLMEGTQAFVYAVEGTSPTTVVKQNVETGLRYPGWVAVETGVRVGTRVITHGVQKVRHGTTVRIVGTQDAQTDMKALLRGLVAPKENGV